MDAPYSLEIRQWAVEEALDLVLSNYEGRETYNRPNRSDTVTDEVLIAAQRLVNFVYDDEDEEDYDDEDEEGKDLDIPEGAPLFSVNVDVYDEGLLITIGGEE